MKSLKFILAIILIFSITSCGTNGDKIGSEVRSLDNIKQDGKLVIGVKYDVYLFGYKDPKDKKVKGFEIDLMKEMTKRMLGDENKVIFKEVNSKTRTKLLQSGDIDLIAATMTITKKRQREISFSDVYFNAGQALLVSKSSKIKSVKDLAKKRVATSKGSTSARNIRKYAPSAVIEEYDNYADAFTSLRAGKVHALTTDDSILLGMQQQDPRFVVLQPPFTEEPYGIGVNKKNKELLLEVNNLLAEIKKDGTYDKIYKKWFEN